MPVQAIIPLNPVTPIAGFNPDGSVFYGPDALGVFIGRQSTDPGMSGLSGPGPTPANLRGAGIPNLTSGGAASNAGTSSVATDNQGSFWDHPLTYDFGPLVDSWVNQIPVIGPLNKMLGSTADPNSPVSGGAGAATGALAFITDVPRVATTVLGFILIIAGIFALSRGPVVQVVSSSVREAVTS